jgi:MFS family permease
MNGFGVEGQKDNPEYNIALAIDDYNPTNYGILVGPAFNILNGVIVLFTGGLTDKVNRRNMICIACLLWGFFTFLNSFCKTFYELLVFRMLLGSTMAFFGPAVYSLIADFFPVDQRTNAFSVYAILTVIGDTISALSINLISVTGWKGAF